MNKATYRIVAWLFIISGNFLAFSGVVTNMWVTDTIGRASISDPSGFSSIYAYASILVLGGIVLIVMGIVFVMYARQPTASPLIN